MLGEFFQLTPLPTNQMFGVYDSRLVLLSYLVATFASYIALDITGRLRDVGNTKLSTTLWICGGAFAMGAGIWSMHFIGMLAFSMPDMSISYDPFWTTLSMVVAVLASAFVFILLKEKIRLWNLIVGGIILGCAIAAMHYTGMQAMKIVTDIHYLPGLFMLSILIAILASEAAIWLALKSNQVVASLRMRLKIVSAFVMGAAICGMHYTGMASAVFTPKSTAVPITSSLDPGILAISIAGVTFIILGIAVIVSTNKEAQNQLMMAKARQAGMSEVAASVLHNVGNILNSVNISTTMLSDKISHSKLDELSDLSKLMNTHKSDLSEYLTRDPAGSEIPNYINKLADQWKKEQADLLDETAILTKNVEHIKDIIAMQQDLSKVTNLEQIVTIDNVMDEALFITGIEINHPEINIEKNYKALRPILVDKVKLLQILVNLIRNAKDAVAESFVENKKITLTLNANSTDKVVITVADNGIGISSGDIVRIFAYGFTTKKQGHGFGLHSSALAAKEMGGILKVDSQGLNKGATFTLEIPYKIPKK